MPAKLDIINAALSRLGADQIDHYGGGSPGASRARATWPWVADEVLAAHPWSGLTRRASLSLIGTEGGGYAYAYTLPDDCLKARHVDGRDAVAFKIEGRALLSNAPPPLTLVYTARLIEDVPDDPDLVAALIARLTAEFAYATTNSAAAAENWSNAYNQALKRARIASGLGAGDSDGLAAPSTVLVVWNRALLHLDLEGLASLGDPGRAAERLRQIYPAIRDEVLAAYPWNTAGRRTRVVEDPAEPAWGFDFRYPLPDDCLVLRDIEDRRAPWKVFGRHLHTNAWTDQGDAPLVLPGLSAMDATAGDPDLPAVIPPVTPPVVNTGHRLGITYTARIDEADFGPLLTAALAARLAQELVGLAPKGAGLAARVDRLARDAFRAARRADAQEAMLERLDRVSAWETERLS